MLSGFNVFSALEAIILPGNGFTNLEPNQAKEPPFDLLFLTWNHNQDRWLFAAASFLKGRLNMKQTAQAIIIIFVFFSYPFICFSQETIRLTNGEWAPFMSEKIPHHGLASHIITAAFALQGITVEYGWFPWSRAYSLAEHDKYNGCVGYTRSTEREKIFYFSDPVFELNDVFFHRKDYPFRWENYEDLKGLRIGITQDYFYGDAFEKAVKRGVFTTDIAHSDELGLRKLLAKRVDAFPLATEIGYAMVRKIFSKDVVSLITNHSKPIRTSQYSIILNKKNHRNKELTAIFNKGLAQLKKSGQYAKFYNSFYSGGYEGN